MPEKFNMPKYSQEIKFHVLNFHCFDYPQKFFNSEFLPIYGNPISLLMYGMTQLQDRTLVVRIHMLLASYS